MPPESRIVVRKTAVAVRDPGAACTCARMPVARTGPTAPDSRGKNLETLRARPEPILTPILRGGFPPYKGKTRNFSTWDSRSRESLAARFSATIPVAVLGLDLHLESLELRAQIGGLPRSLGIDA